MCGIIGYLDRTSPIDADEFNRMRDKLKHRGPDGSGSKFFKNYTIALGHRRLSIVDLSDTASQPMTNSDSSIWLTYNGEIYNYELLKSELIDKKYVFRSNSDSEVLIHGYDEWGIKGLLDKINGIFAFAIWDSRLDKLIIARDRFGVKPFYYFTQESKFIFASELKAIIDYDKIAFDIDKNALADFLIYSYVPSPKSIFKNIKKLQPGHYLTYSYKTNEISTSKYWSVTIRNDIVSLDYAQDKVTDLIDSSIRGNLIGDVPIGIFLSGGYDSTLLLQKLVDIKDHVNSFTVGYENLKVSEHLLARKISNVFNTNHHEKIIHENYDLYEIIDEVTDYYDEPYAYTSMIPYYIISKEAAKKNKVVLAGDGGDEAFAGYKWYNQVFNYQKYLSLKGRVKQLLYGEKNLLLKKYDSKMSNSYNFFTNNDFLQIDLKYLLYKRGLSFYSDNYINKVDYLKRFQYLDLNTFLPEACLTRADRSSMANGLEVRVPYLDHHIFDFLYSLDTNVYFNSNKKKILIRNNISKQVAKEVFNAPKPALASKAITLL